MPSRIGNPKRGSLNSAVISNRTINGSGGGAAGEGGGGALVSDAAQFATLRDRESKQAGRGNLPARRATAGPAFGSPALMYDNPMQRPDDKDIEEFGDDDEEEGKGLS